MAVNSQLQQGENLATGPDAVQPAVRPQVSTAEGASPATLQDMLTSDTQADAEFEVSEEALTALRPHAASASSAQQGIETTGMAAQMARSAQSVATGAANTTLATSLSASISVPVQDSGWDTAVAERVLLMANNKLQNAELRLSPADLGPLRVELRIEDTTANVNFHTNQAVTREALEQAMPKLREMLADSGLQLGRCDVSDSGLGDRAEERQARETHSSHGLGEATGESAGDSAGEVRIRSAVGLVDTFA